MKGLDVREEIKGGKKKEKENFGKIKLLAVPNHKKLFTDRTLIGTEEGPKV